MRLTPDVVSAGDQGLNCLGDRELSLRGLAIPVVENLAPAKDGFDTIDLSANALRALGQGFPRLPRVRALYAAHNRIEAIESGLADALPNLDTLVLTGNRVATAAALNLRELARLPRLEVLCVAGNPVASLPSTRAAVVVALPALKVYNFCKVTAAERAAVGAADGAAAPGKPAAGAKRKRAEIQAPRARASLRDPTARLEVEVEVDGDDDDDDDGDDGDGGGRAAKRARRLSKAESAAVKALIERARTVEEVQRIQRALRDGTAHTLLGVPPARG